MDFASSNLRAYTISKEGHFDAAHRLPNYAGECANLHGHTWRILAEVEFPAVPREIVSPEDPDGSGILVDFKDVSELWEEYDHTYLNDFCEIPTAEVLANALLEALQDLVEDTISPHDLAFQATIHLWESPSSHVCVSLWHDAAETCTGTGPGACQCADCQIERLRAGIEE